MVNGHQPRRRRGFSPRHAREGSVIAPSLTATHDQQQPSRARRWIRVPHGIQVGQLAQFVWPAVFEEISEA